MAGSLGANLVTCLRCKFHAENCAGPCACTADGKDIDIRDHAQDNDCPKGFYAEGKPEPRRASVREEEGRERWAELHRRAAGWDGADPEAEREFIAHLADGLGGCSCRQDWAELLDRMPVDLSSAEAYFAWSVAAHNAVSLRLGKVTLLVGEARARCCSGSKSQACSSSPEQTPL